MLFVTGLIAVVIVAVTGKILQRLVPRLNHPWSLTMWNISDREFWAGMLLFSVIVAPLTMFVGSKLATSEALRYEEFYNGVETDAIVDETICHPGSDGGSASSGHSNCEYEYRTGETYTYYVSTVEAYPCTDANGNSTTCTRTVLVPETGYIYNPYATAEYRYSITDSLGETYRFPTIYVATDAVPYSSEPIPPDIPRGEPAEWTESRLCLEAGDPRAVTRMFTYDNYILAAKDDMLLPYSEDVDRYLESELLPDHTANIMDDPITGFNDSFAEKLSFVGIDVRDEAAWQEALMDFNAALGSKLRGDMHMVIIDSSSVDNPNDYLNALKAYWLGDHFGRRAIAKNAVIVVIGTDGTSVDWARATTGMPFGNETMIRAIEARLTGTPLTPEAVIGNPKTVIVPATGESEDDLVEVTLANPSGELEDIVLSAFAFQRACMDCADEGEGIGYDNLIAKIQPQPWQRVIMAIVIVVLSIGWWLFVAATSVFGREQLSPESAYRDPGYDSPYRDLYPQAPKKRTSPKYRTSFRR